MALHLKLKYGTQGWGGKNAKDIEESIRQGHFSSNQITQRNIVDKRLKQVRDTLIGGQNLKIWFGEGWAYCGMDFIYKEKQFRFHFMSGTKEQFLKDHYYMIK